MVPTITWDRRPSDLLVMGTTIMIRMYSFVGAKRGVALSVFGSLKLGHLEKKFGFCFVDMNVLYLPCKCQRNRPKGLREIRDRARFFCMFLWAPTIVVPIYSFVGAKRGVALPVFGS